jgi:hypothetical protein
LSNYRSQIYWKHVITDNTKKFRKNWKRNEILMKSVKIPEISRFFSCYYVPFRAVIKIFWLKMYFYINTNLIYVDLSLNKLSYKVKRKLLQLLQAFSLFPYQIWKSRLFAEKCSEQEFLRIQASLFKKTTLHPSVYVLKKKLMMVCCIKVSDVNYWVHKNICIMG